MSEAGLFSFFMSALCFIWVGVLTLVLVTRAGLALIRAYNQLTSLFSKSTVSASIFIGSCVAAGLITLGKFL